MEYTPRDQLCEYTCCIVETKPVGGPPSVHQQPIKAVLAVDVFFAVLVAVVAASILFITISLHDTMLEIGSRLRREKRTSAYGAVVVVMKPGGNAVRANEVVAWKADQEFNDAGFGRQRAALFHVLEGT